MIRQTAINSGERGLLLLRVRDEIRMVMASYQSLYESSIAFGLRKALLAEQRRAELQAKVRGRALLFPPFLFLSLTPSRAPLPPPFLAQIKLCTAELADLERAVESLSGKAATLESSEAERSAAEQEKHAAEVAKLQATNVTLKEELEMLLAPPRK